MFEELQLSKFEAWCSVWLIQYLCSGDTKWHVTIIQRPLVQRIVTEWKGRNIRHKMS